MAVLNATMDRSNGDVVEQSCSKGINGSEMFLRTVFVIHKDSSKCLTAIYPLAT